MAPEHSWQEAPLLTTATGPVWSGRSRVSSQLCFTGEPAMHPSSCDPGPCLCCSLGPLPLLHQPPSCSLHTQLQSGLWVTIYHPHKPGARLSPWCA